MCSSKKATTFYVTPNEAKNSLFDEVRLHSHKDISKQIGLKTKTIEIYRDKLKLKLDQFSRFGNPHVIGQFE